MAARRYIIDTDAGTDDAVALVILIAAHKLKKIEIVGITCVHGNTRVEHVVNNVFRILTVCGVLDIPVYKGISSSLLALPNASDARDCCYHGVDGFGDVYTDKPDISRLKEEHAICALARIVAEDPDEISVITLGPLTNIAVTIKMYPEFLENAREFFVMGGNSKALGNMTSQAEFNFFADPESVHIFLNYNAKPVWWLPWETCLHTKVPHDFRQNVFGKINTPWVKMINDIENGVYQDTSKLFDHYKPCDALLAAFVLRPDMGEEIIEFHADIELGGNKTRGQVVLDHLKFNKPNVRLIERLDSEIFQEVLLLAADPLNYKGSVI